MAHFRGKVAYFRYTVSHLGGTVAHFRGKVAYFRYTGGTVALLPYSLTTQSLQPFIPSLGLNSDGDQCRVYLFYI